MRQRNGGFTLIEVIILIGIALAALLLFSFANSEQIARADLCRTQLIALGPTQQLCMQDIALGRDPCLNCQRFNDQVTVLNEGVCRDFGPVAPFQCPIREPG